MTLPVIFMGAAFEDLFWFSSITFLGSLTCGLGMLVALDRRDKVGDRLACAWLLGTMLFSSVWVPFAGGLLVDIALRRGERDWRRRAYTVVVPVVLWLLWYAGWGHEAESALSLHNVATTPLFVLDSFGSAIAALLGLATPVEGIASPAGLDWGRPLAVALGGLAIWRAYRIERIPRSFWVVLTIGLAFWVLGGFDLKPGRVPWASRYQLLGGIFVLLVAAELLRGVPLGRRLLGPALVVVAASVASNGLFLHEAYESYASSTEVVRGNLTALEIARDTVDPSFYLEEEFADTGFDHIDAGSYFAAVDDFGSPAYTVAELQAAPSRRASPPTRCCSTRCGSGSNRSRIGRAGQHCFAAAPGQEFAVPAGGVAIAAGSKPVTDIQMRRFATPAEGEPMPVDFQAGAGPGEAVAVPIPARPLEGPLDDAARRRAGEGLRARTAERLP